MISGGREGGREAGPSLWAPGGHYLWLLRRISNQQGQEVMNCRE